MFKIMRFKSLLGYGVCLRILKLVLIKDVWVVNKSLDLIYLIKKVFMDIKNRNA